MYKLTHSTSVTRVADGACIPADQLNTDWHEYQVWLDEGNTPLPADPIPEPSPFERATQAVQAELDRQARAIGYDSIYTAVGYVGDPNPKFNAEAVALRDWRSACWTYCGEVRHAVEGGAAMPTLEELMTGLPVFTPPVSP